MLRVVKIINGDRQVRGFWCMGERECEVINQRGNSAGLNHKYLGQRQADKNSTVMPCLKTLRKQKLFGLGRKEDSSVVKSTLSEGLHSFSSQHPTPSHNYSGSRIQHSNTHICRGQCKEKVKWKILLLLLLLFGSALSMMPECYQILILSHSHALTFQGARATGACSHTQMLKRSSLPKKFADGQIPR